MVLPGLDSGVSIIVNKPPNRDWYTSLDDICGCVTFARNLSAFRRILVYLEGIACIPHAGSIFIRPNKSFRRCANLYKDFEYSA